eukprot:2496526-Pleurochrysis_carterae.AAC.3
MRTACLGARASWRARNASRGWTVVEIDISPLILVRLGAPQPCANWRGRAARGGGGRRRWKRRRWLRGR